MMTQHKELERPIFVVGYMHSGTTLLLKILGRHPSVFSGEAETKYFECLPLIRRAYPDLDDEKKLREFLTYAVEVVRRGYKITGKSIHGGAGIAPEHIDAIMDEAKKSRDHAHIFCIVSDHLTRVAGKARWLEKTPTHVLHVDQIIQSVPGAVFVEIVRDPRDVLSSKKTRRQIVWETGRYTTEQKPLKHLEKAYDSLWDSLSWKATVRAGQAARRKYPERFFTIRYEDLVTDPETRIREVCDFLQMDFCAEMLNVQKRNSAERGEVEKEGISPDAVGRWQRTLTPAEAALCESLAKAELDTLNYRRSPAKFVARARVPLLMTRSMFEFSQRLYRRWRLGGSAYSLNVLLTYWKRFTKLVNT